MKNFFRILLAAGALFAVQISSAHETWFVPRPASAPAKPLLFTSWNTMNSSMLLLAFAAFIAALLIHYAIRTHKWTRRVRSVLGAYKARTPGVIRSLTGLFLFFASFSGFLFAADLRTFIFPDSIERTLLTIEFIIGLGLVIGIAPRLMAAMGFTLYIISLFIFPLPGALVYAAFIGIFAYIFIIGDPALPRARGAKFFPNFHNMLADIKAKPYAMAVLRITAAAGFILSGFFFKLYEPYYALSFMRMHDVNFMQMLGFAAFTNEMFVMAAGITEILIGVLLLFGLLPRFTGAVLFALFTITAFMFGIFELVGHLPLFAAAFALLVNGGGERWSAEAPPIHYK